MNKPTPPAAKPRNDINEGEGSRTAARHYNDQTRAFVDAGKVDAAAKAAANNQRFNLCLMAYAVGWRCSDRRIAAHRPRAVKTHLG